MDAIINIRDKNHGAVTESKTALFFYGDEGNPFLAPRGLHTINGKLIVADTAQNRIFIWNEMPTTSYQIPDSILGQLNATNTNAIPEARQMHQHYYILPVYGAMGKN